MTVAGDPENAHNVPVRLERSAVSPESPPFSLLWITAVNPRTFTPRTWTQERETTIRLRSGNGGAGANAYRCVSRYPRENLIELKDEIYPLAPGQSEADAHDVSQFRYRFTTDGALTDYDPNPVISPRLEELITTMSGLVRTAGSTIQAGSYTTGPESSFVSDGTQWIETRTGIAVPVQPAIAAGRLALGSPEE